MSSSQKQTPSYSQGQRQRLEQGNSQPPRGLHHKAQTSPVNFKSPLNTETSHSRNVIPEITAPVPLENSEVDEFDLSTPSEYQNPTQKRVELKDNDNVSATPVTSSKFPLDSLPHAKHLSTTSPSQSHTQSPSSASLHFREQTQAHAHPSPLSPSPLSQASRLEEFGKKVQTAGGSKQSHRVDSGTCTNIFRNMLIYLKALFNTSSKTTILKILRIVELV